MIYEFLCASCTSVNNEEYIFCLNAKEPPKTNPDCPNCGSNKVMRKWSPAAVHFKGDGFYSSGNKNGDDVNV